MIRGWGPLPGALPLPLWCFFLRRRWRWGPGRSRTPPLFAFPPRALLALLLPLRLFPSGVGLSGGPGVWGVFSCRVVFAPPVLSVGPVLRWAASGSSPLSLSSPSRSCLLLVRVCVASPVVFVPLSSVGVVPCPPLTAAPCLVALSQYET